MEYIIVDIDGTIVDNRKRKQVCVNLVTAKSLSFSEVNAEFGLEHLNLSSKEIDQIFDLFIANSMINDPRCIDTPIPGASKILNEFQDLGVGIIYLTGRHHDINNSSSMRNGTIRNFQINQFPLPDNSQIHLVMKPNREETDKIFKKQMYQTLISWGFICLIVGNRPDDFPVCSKMKDALRIAITYTNETALKYPRDVLPFRDWNTAYSAMHNHLLKRLKSG
jgi:predicted secreted acid phosphatase